MGWRTKFVFLLMVYAAGFATAVYCLAPTPEATASSSLRLPQVDTALTTQALLKSLNTGMHKCFGFSKEAAEEAAKLIQAKLNEVNKAPPQG